MKITIEKQEWQLLGQLAIEAGKGKFSKGLALPAVILWEFFMDNARAFNQPQRSRRKFRTSTAIGIYAFLCKQELRNDGLWDSTLIELTSKFHKALVPKNILEDETPF